MLMKSLYDFMAEKEDIKGKYPKIILDQSKPKNDLLCPTGYFDPDVNAIRIFVVGRLLKDYMRTCAHEFVHYFQQLRGDIEKAGFSGDKITEDENLVKIEAEAYLKGNLLFRSWTETLR